MPGSVAQERTRCRILSLMELALVLVRAARKENGVGDVTVLGGRTGQGRPLSEVSEAARR